MDSLGEGFRLQATVYGGVVYDVYVRNGLYHQITSSSISKKSRKVVKLLIKLFGITSIVLIIYLVLEASR